MLDSFPPIALISAAILLGFIGLVWSADRFVAGAAAIARSFGVAPLVIGLTIVSFGTSAPEVMVSISAALRGAGDLAVGNAIGSNIANIGLVLGVTTLFASIPVQRHILKHELPIVIIVTLLSGVFLYDGTVSPIEGSILLALLFPAVMYLVNKKQGELNPNEIAEEEETIVDMPRAMAVFWFALGLATLMISSEILVWGAKSAALMAGVSPLIIGLTVIAVGTSLPELAASLMSALKGHHDIALGNIIGSNMFNLMAVMSIPGIAGGIGMEADVFYRDYSVMLGLTLLLALLTIKALWFARRAHSPASAKLGKMAGLIMLCAYIGYYIVLFNTVDH